MPPSVSAWQSRCEEAFSEPEPLKVFDRVVAAETAIFRRLHELNRVPESVELEAIEEALRRLRLLITNPSSSSGNSAKVAAISQSAPRSPLTLSDPKNNPSSASAGVTRPR